MAPVSQTMGRQEIASKALQPSNLVDRSTLIGFIPSPLTYTRDITQSAFEKIEPMLTTIIPPRCGDLILRRIEIVFLPFRERPP